MSEIDEETIARALWASDNPPGVNTASPRRASGGSGRIRPDTHHLLANITAEKITAGKPER